MMSLFDLNRPNRSLHARTPNRVQRGQTLIIALMVLGVLLILATVFLGFISRGIRSAQRGQQRSVATDLAEAGIRYAHAQLMDSELGADWHPEPRAFSRPLVGATLLAARRDPDFSYLRPHPQGAEATLYPNDQGGPDGLGAYARLDMSNGRVLIRVRYAPSDASIFNGSPTGNLRTPGRSRGYLILESVGRSGQFVGNDPTTVTDREKAQERKMIAFASIGLIDQARFISNKFSVTRPAEIGIPRDMGAVYGSIPVDTLSLQMGNIGTLYVPPPPSNPNGTATPTLTPIPYGGGLHCNADLTIHGIVDANINTYLGDQWLVAGTIQGADANSVLNASVTSLVFNGGTGTYQYQTTVRPFMNNATTDPLNSRAPQYATENFLRDGMGGVDAAGNPRGARRLEPPSILRRDPQTGLTRYVQMTRESGANGPNGNTGIFGYGRGVYVNNLTDRQIRPDEGGRADLGTAESLVYDWLNPGNGSANSGWKGPFYVPTGAVMLLRSDGFIIMRNSQAVDANERTWKNPDGSDTASPSIRYRLGVANNQLYIVNSFTPGVNVNGALTSADYLKGQPFNGVVYFEGNVRVRGVIPTDVQMTVVSGASAYIEGSITKGLIGNDWTASRPAVPGPTLQHQVASGTMLDYPSRSMLMLMAKEYVAVNSTQFLGTAPGQTLDVKEGESQSAVQMRASDGTISLNTELLLNPETGTPGNATTWQPFPTTYAMQRAASPPDSSPVAVRQNLLLTHSMDDSGGAAPATFLSMDVGYGIDNVTTTHANDWNFLFPLSPYNAALAYQGSDWAEYPNPPGPMIHSKGYSLVEGLGDQPWQKFPKFETLALPFLDSSFAYPGSTTFPARLQLEGKDTGSGDDVNNPRLGYQGSFVALLQDTSGITFRANNQFGVATSNWLLARAALVPMDVRIEASVYAEEGSFFVIPGRSYNTNPNDRRDLYETAVQNYINSGKSATQARDAADVDRLTNFGVFPTAPFYGEPLDVKVNVIGSVSENMPPPMSQQAEWLRRWGWIPRNQGAARRPGGNSPVDLEIPVQHIPNATPADPRFTNYVPNIIVSYDPALAGGRVLGFGQADSFLRSDGSGRPLPPLPRLPVSPTLSYFGEVNP